MFSFKNFSFPPSQSPVPFDRPMVIQQAPRVSDYTDHHNPTNNMHLDAIQQQHQQECWDFLPPSVHVQQCSPPNNGLEEYENWENTFHMRPFNLNNFPSGQTTYRTTHRSQSIAMHRARMGFVSSTQKSLDILRQNLQKSINKDIDEVVRKYLDRFFKPGIENLRRNNGENSVSDEHVQGVCRQMLEEAKKMYITVHTRGSTPVGDYSDSETGSQTEWKFGRPFTRSPQMRKRKDSDTDSEASQVHVKPVKKKGRPPLYLSGGVSGRSTPSKQGKHAEPIKREGPKWNPERLGKDTVFVMGARANKALGFGLTRGRLYIKHPELFKYCGDADDKLWLYDHNLMPATGGKAYMLILDDIRELAESEEYRNAPGVVLDELVGFHVPSTMLDKMRVYMTSMRTDIPGRKQRGRPFTSIENTVEPPLIEQPFEIKVETVSLLPDFMSNSPASSSSAIKRTDLESSVPGSPTDDLDLRGDDASPGQPSPFLLPMGLDDVSPANPDVSPSPSELHAALESADDPPLSAPFDITGSP